MAQQVQAFVTLDSVINDYLNESEQSNHKYFKLWHLAFRGFENLGIDFFYKVQTYKLLINANLTVNIPSNCLKVIKAGILNDSGGIIPLYYNPNLTTFADLLPNRIELINDPQSAPLEWGWNSGTWCNYWNGNGYTNVYGVSSGEPFVGSFNIDTENNVIILNERYEREYLMVECLCSPIEGEDYSLPVHFREALVAWLFWKDGNAKSIRSNMQLGNKRDWRHEFYNERRNAIARWKPLRIMDAYQASQEQTRLAVKT